jgi:hypothetical protein
VFARDAGGKDRDFCAEKCRISRVSRIFPKQPIVISRSFLGFSGTDFLEVLFSRDLGHFLGLVFPDGFFDVPGRMVFRAKAEVEGGDGGTANWSLQNCGLQIEQSGQLGGQTAIQFFRADRRSAFPEEGGGEGRVVSCHLFAWAVSFDQ